MSVKIIEGNGTTETSVTAGALHVLTPGTLSTGVEVGGGPSNGPAMFSENDSGLATGARYVLAPETDDDYRFRIAHETMHDTETFNYAAQNTGKHMSAATTMALAWSAAGLTTNSANITTTTTAVQFGSYACFPMFGASQLYCEIGVAFTAQPVSNTIIDFGLFLRSAANPYTPTDGAFFRLTSAGLQGVISQNGTETTTSVFAHASAAYINSQVKTYLIAIHETEVNFWVDDVLQASIDTPQANGQPFMSSALPFSIRHAITGGAAGGATSMVLRDYTVTSGGTQFADTLGNTGNRMHGSYQGLSGGTMGSLANYANSANPTAAVPTNTTAALGSGLGGQFWETDTLAVTTDGIISSYQVPAATTNVAGRRLAIRGVRIDSYVQTALTGGGYVAQWSLAFGHTAVSLATGEAAATKAPRRLPLGVQAVASGALASVALSSVNVQLQSPVYANPGEFVAVVKKKVGTAPSAGVIAHVIALDYSWE